jgi:hypothetical protein
MSFKIIADFFLKNLFNEKEIKTDLGKTNYIRLVVRFTSVLCVMGTIFIFERYYTLGLAYYELLEKNKALETQLSEVVVLDDIADYISNLREQNNICYELLFKCKKDPKTGNCIVEESKGKHKI